MRRQLIVLASLAAVALAAAAGWARRGGEAGDKSLACLDMRRCKKGEKPPACCKPPPCVYFRQVEMKAALQELFASAAMRAEALRAANGDPAAAARRLEQRILQLASDGTLGKKLPACAGDPIPDPPGVSTRGDCARYIGDEKTSEDQAHRKFATCGEFLQAGYRHEDLHKDRCEHQNSQERAKAPIQQYADEEVAGYEKELQSLRDELQQWSHACSATVDAVGRAALVKAGVEALGQQKGASR